jgi:hypothetical protein
MQSRRLEAGPADPGMQHLPDVVRSRLDSWYPSHLPARFRPPTPHRSPRLLRPLPLALAALLLVLLAASAAAGPTRALTEVIVNLAGSHPSASPTPRPHSHVRSGPAQERAGVAITSVTPVQAAPEPILDPALAARRHRTASEARTALPTPAASPQSTAAVSPPPPASPSPGIVEIDPPDTPATPGTQEPSPAPQPTPAVPAAPPALPLSS